MHNKLQTAFSEDSMGIVNVLISVLLIFYVGFMNGTYYGCLQ